MQGFDVQTIANTVGAAACAKGMEYARRGSVTSISMSRGTGQQPKIVGKVQGSARYPYTVIVTAIPARGGAAGLAFGVCTCPVRNNCKHVAALMYAAGRDPLAEALTATTDRARTGAARPAWEDALRPAPAHAGPAGLWPAADPDPRTIGLLIEPRHIGPGRLILSMRPVVRGERGRWVRSGISWSDASVGYRGGATAPLRLLREIYALHLTDGGGYHY